MKTSNKIAVGIITVYIIFPLFSYITNWIMVNNTSYDMDKMIEEVAKREFKVADIQGEDTYCVYFSPPHPRNANFSHFSFNRTPTSMDIIGDTLRVVLPKSISNNKTIFMDGGQIRGLEYMIRNGEKFRTGYKEKPNQRGEYELFLEPVK